MPFSLPSHDNISWVILQTASGVQSYHKLKGHFPHRANNNLNTNCGDYFIRSQTFLERAAIVFLFSFISQLFYILLFCILHHLYDFLFLSEKFIFSLTRWNHKKSLCVFKAVAGASQFCKNPSSCLNNICFLLRMSQFLLQKY